MISRYDVTQAERHAAPSHVAAFRQNRHDIAVAAAAALLATAFVLAFVLTRQFFTYGTETDYISSFVPEAQRLLAGKSLELSFHPPVYVIVVAMIQWVVRDWFATGLAITVTASAVVLFTQFLFFDRLVGRAAAWGAFAGLVTSEIFLTFSSLATSDLFFFALFSIALLVALKAVMDGGSRWWWLGLGALLTVTILTRTNGVTLLLLLATPLLTGGRWERRFVNCGIVGLGLVLVFAGWALYATMTGSPIGPGKTHANLAMTYYGDGDRVSAESRLSMEAEYDNLFDVITQEPVHLALIYMKDLLLLPAKIFRSHLVIFPVAAFALFGLILFCFKDLSWLKAGFIVVLLAQIALVNMKTFEARYYLFLAPLLGASAAIAFAALHERLGDRRLQLAAHTFIVALVLVSTLRSVRGTVRTIHTEDAELRSVIHETHGLIDSGAVLISRKTHLAFYTRSSSIYMPDTQSVTQLGQYIYKNLSDKPVYVYYGRYEQLMRPELAALAVPASTPAWLDVVASTDAPPAWVLYKVDQSALAAVPEIVRGARTERLPHYTILDWSDLEGQRFERTAYK